MKGAASKLSVCRRFLFLPTFNFGISHGLLRVTIVLQTNAHISMLEFPNNPTEDYFKHKI